jgi:multidrug transporter EmrE-like cation transporter
VGSENAGADPPDLVQAGRKPRNEPGDEAAVDELEAPPNRTWEDEIAGAFDVTSAATRRASVDEASEAVSSSGPNAATPTADDAVLSSVQTPSLGLPAVGRGQDLPQPPPPGLPESLERGRRLVAVLSIAYGTIATIVILGWTVWSFPAGITWYVFSLGLAVGIAASGVLLFRGDRKAHAWAGLACLGLCFYPAWQQILSLFHAATVGDFLNLFLTTGGFLVLFSVPIYVTYWALRYEQAKQELEESDRR